MGKTFDIDGIVPSRSTCDSKYSLKARRFRLLWIFTIIRRLEKQVLIIIQLPHKMNEKQVFCKINREFIPKKKSTAKRTTGQRKGEKYYNLNKIYEILSVLQLEGKMEIEVALKKHILTLPLAYKNLNFLILQKIPTPIHSVL